MRELSQYFRSEIFQRVGLHYKPITKLKGVDISSLHNKVKPFSPAATILGSNPVRIQGLVPKDYFNVKEQKFLPIHAIVHPNIIVHESALSGQITDITYTKPRVVPGTASVSKVVGSIISYFTSLDLFPSMGRTCEVLKTRIQFQNEQFLLYIGPGILYDGEGKILAAVVLDKQILHVLNKEEQDTRFYKLYHYMQNMSSQQTILKKFGSLIVSKDFVESRKYRNLYNNFISTFVGKETDKMKLIITNNVEESIFKIPDPAVATYPSVAAKVQEQKDVWRRVLND